MSYALKTDFLKDAPLHRSNGKMPGKPKGVAIHNAAGSVDARTMATYLVYNSKEVSAHFAVDESEVYQCMPLDWTSWCQGTAEGNNYYWSVEITRDMDYSSDNYAKAEENAAILAAKLLTDAGLTIDGLKRHYDFNGKICPHRMFEVEAGKTTGRSWEQFRQLVKSLMATPAPEPEPVKLDLVWLDAGTEIRDKPPREIETATRYTIVERRGRWGRLKAGGWVKLEE